MLLPRHSCRPPCCSPRCHGACSFQARDWDEAPAFYFTNPYAVVAPYDDVPVPPGCRAFDFELEVAAVIGAPGRDLTAEQARDHIAGYTIMNDWSARDLQSREMQVNLGPAKGKDTATTLGPWLVTADELEPFEDLVADASRGTWVRPGDVLGSGTCGNGGCLAELWGLRGEQDPPPLRPGDIVEITVEGIGSVRNAIVAGTAPVPIPEATPRPRERPR